MKTQDVWFLGLLATLLIVAALFWLAGRQSPPTANPFTEPTSAPSVTPPPGPPSAATGFTPPTTPPPNSR